MGNFPVWVFWCLRGDYRKVHDSMSSEIPLMDHHNIQIGSGSETISVILVDLKDATSVGTVVLGTIEDGPTSRVVVSVAEQVQGQDCSGLSGATRS